MVFEALGRVRSADPVPLRDQLASHATRMGFPDVDWHAYLEASATTTVDRPDYRDFAKTLESLLATTIGQR